MTERCVWPGGGQKVGGADELTGNLSARQRRRLRRGQFQPKRHPLQEAANLGNGLAVGCGWGKAPLLALRTLDEERGRLEILQRASRIGGWKSQPVKMKEPLAAQSQPGARGDEQLDRGRLL
jgi:hypothetical protein